jgi:undecaprenyl-diphosphatase
MLGSIANLDVSLAHDVNHAARVQDGLEDVAGFYGTYSEAMFIVLCAAVVLAGFVLHRRSLQAAGVLAVLSAGLGLGIAHFVADAVNRPRPFVAHPDQIALFTHHAADPGFPSDHATAAFAIAGALILRLGWRWWPVLLAAAVLAVVRVVLGLHYPTDVIAGAALGLGSAWVVCKLAQTTVVTRHARVLRA